MAVSFPQSSLFGQNSGEGNGGRKHQSHHARRSSHDGGPSEKFFVVREDDRNINTWWTERLVRQFHTCTAFRQIQHSQKMGAPDKH